MIVDLVKGKPKGTSQAFSGLSLKDKGKMTQMQIFCCWLIVEEEMEGFMGGWGVGSGSGQVEEFF